MKILIIAPMLPQPSGPGAIPMLLDAQLRGLRQRHEVTLITGMGDEPWESEAAEQLRRSSLPAFIVDRRRPSSGWRRTQRRVDLAGRWAISRIPWRNLWFSPPAVQAAVDRAVSERSFDVVAVEDSGMAGLRLPAGLPAVLSDHEVVRARPEPAQNRSGLTGAIRSAVLEDDWRRAERFQAAMWGRYQRIQVFTREDADAISRLAPGVTSRVRVNPFGLAIPAACDPAREIEDSVLFLGNFTHPPNRDAAHWLAGQIMPRVWAERPQARLRLVGSDPPADITCLASERIEVLANVPETEPYVESAAVCVAPVRLGGGMRVKVLTALARGKALVTTSRGAQGFALGDGELPMLISDEADGLASALLRVLGDAGLRRALGERARALSIQEHSPEAWAERLERVYGEVIGAPAKLTGSPA